MFSLARRRLTGADNPDVFVAVGMSHDQDPIGTGHSNRDEPVFRRGMIWVRIRQSQGISKNCRSFLE